MAKRKALAQLGIGRNKPTFVIAEVGINHNGDFDTARKLIDAAKVAGADAVKFQTYVTEKRVKKDSPIYAILKKCELSHDVQKKLKSHADKAGIIFFSTPFDEESVSFLEKLGVPLMKIASFDAVNLKLLKAVAATGIPIIMSRGMTSKKELDAAIAVCKKAKTEFALLHCVSAYPTPPEEVNLRIVETLLRNYEVTIGYSDHTLGIDACIYAVARGATILEKHFTLNTNMEGPDHKLSADPSSLKEMISRVRAVEAMLGKGVIESLPAEKGTRPYRRPSK